jgi:hypothetical protein
LDTLSLHDALPISIQLIIDSASLITYISGDRMLVINYIHHINRTNLCPRNKEVYRITQVLARTSYGADTA